MIGLPSVALYINSLPHTCQLTTAELNDCIVCWWVKLTQCTHFAMYPLTVMTNLSLQPTTYQIACWLLLNPVTLPMKPGSVISLTFPISEKSVAEYLFWFKINTIIRFLTDRLNASLLATRSTQRLTGATTRPPTKFSFLIMSLLLNLLMTILHLCIPVW